MERGLCTAAFGIFLIALLTATACQNESAAPPSNPEPPTACRHPLKGISDCPPPVSEHVYVVVMTDSGFEPKTVTIRAGEIVVWVNKGTQFRWPASDFHPVHADYPEKGGCIGSAFDACNVVKPGENFSFTFKRTGTWSYHDHLNPIFTGRVIVK